ncbi:MAG: DUF1684 domain-containing protein [Cytophagales bacterium]|nr:DUF1684 domain-containing protein [Cytophagales bacterium]
MKVRTNYLLLTAIVVLVMLVIFYSFSDLQTNDAYVTNLQQERREKDAFFKQDEHSPIPPELRGKFKGLNYFPIDPAYRIKADLIPIPSSDTGAVVLKTTTGEDRLMYRYAIARFQLNGKEHQLTIFVSTQSPKVLFIPFKDLTNGRETYPTGRYLDLPLSGKSRHSAIMLDFNKAYNPYCAYSELYSCPIPPPENHLSVAIKAGEMNYTK